MSLDTALEAGRAKRAPRTSDRASLKPVSYDRDAILTVEEVARGIRVSVPMVDRLDLPTIYCGRIRRFHWGTVLDALARRSRSAKSPAERVCS